MNNRPLSGFLLALTTAVAWGSLPIAVQQVLPLMDAATLVWYRFTVAAFGLLLLLAFTRRLPAAAGLASPRWGGLMLLGVLGLSLNFFLFAHSLNDISPATTQVLWQFAPFAMMLFGVLLFKERFGRWQQAGLLFLLAGIAAFFHDRFGELFQLGRYTRGVLVCLAGVFIWVLYGVVQKLMLRRFTSQQILLLIYSGCALVMLPFADFGRIGALHGAALVCFVYCCLNTLIGYGAFAEALNRWDAAKVSAVTVLSPIFTLLFSHLAHSAFPALFPAAETDWLSYAGAAVAVTGTLLSTAGQQLFGTRKETT